jgi:hypothetical protein
MNNIFESKFQLNSSFFYILLLEIRHWPLTKEPSSFKDIFDIRIGVHNLSLNSTDFIHSQSHSIENFTLVRILFNSIRTTLFFS